MPLQAGVNSHLAKQIGSTMHAGFISFLGGILAMTLACVITRSFFPSPQKIMDMPPHLLTGGLLGCTFVLITIILAPKMGATLYISCLIAGQLVGSLILDHFGLLGFAVHPINWLRVVGILFLFTGVLMVRYF